MATAKSKQHLRDGIIAASCVLVACAAAYGVWLWYRRDDSVGKEEPEAEDSKPAPPTPRLSKESVCRVLEQSLKNARRSLLEALTLVIAAEQQPSALKKDVVADIVEQVLDLYEKKLAAYNVAACEQEGISADDVFAALRYYSSDTDLQALEAAVRDVHPLALSRGGARAAPVLAAGLGLAAVPGAEGAVTREAIGAVVREVTQVAPEFFEEAFSALKTRFGLGDAEAAGRVPPLARGMATRVRLATHPVWALRRFTFSWLVDLHCAADPVIAGMLAAEEAATRAAFDELLLAEDEEEDAEDGAEDSEGEGDGGEDSEGEGEGVGEPE